MSCFRGLHGLSVIYDAEKERKSAEYGSKTTGLYGVLNSVTNIHKAKGSLLRYENIQCFLDNDDAGRNAYLQLSKELGKPVTDASTLYNGFKDLNEYLCAESKHSEKAENKKAKGIKL